MHEAEHPNWYSEQPRGIGCRGRREGVRMDGTHAYLPVSMADHIDVWEKPSQYCNYPPININKFKNKIDLKDKGKKNYNEISLHTNQNSHHQKIYKQ